MAGDFGTFYGNHPWVNIDKKERQWYFPDLITGYSASSVYAPYVTARRNFSGHRATSMTVTKSLDLHPNTDPLSNRQLWMPAAHFDSEEVTITFNRYGGKVAYHEYDDMVTYWKVNGKAGLRSIVKGGLGRHMTNVLDLVARNAFFASPYQYYAGGGTDFNALSTSDTVATSDLLDIHLGMNFREVPYAVNPESGSGQIICITTPGVMHDLQLQSTDAWIDRLKYADPSRLLRYEVGTWQNIRFVMNARAMLPNCGAITTQKAITTALAAGSGAIAQRDSAWEPGQTAAVHTISLADFDAGDYVVGDLVTIHTARTSSYGITNGVDYTDGKIHNLRVMAVDATANTISVATPVMEDFITDLTGAGVYGYVTKGRHIHSLTFVGGPESLVLGVGKEPRLHSPRPVDDFDSMHRFSWDANLGYNLFNPEQVEVMYTAGSYRYIGDRVVQ